MEKRFTNLEITLMFDDIKNTLEQHGEIQGKILAQATYTNGKLRRVIFVLTIVASITATLLVTNGSEVISILKLFL